MSYYKLPYILYRDYPDFGYLTDNRNFGYDTASKSSVKVGDRVLSKTGSVFYSVLTETPQTVEEITCRLLKMFVGVTATEIEKDVVTFFQELARDGFVGCGQGEVAYPVCFSYADKLPKTLHEDEIEKNKLVEKGILSVFIHRVAHKSLHYAV